MTTRRARARGPARALRVVLTAVAAASLLSAGAFPSAAASFTLGETETREALQAGARSVTAEAFGAEWLVSDARGDTVLVVTPFHRLALAARHAAFADGEVGPSEVARLVRTHRDRLVLWATLRGERENFARHLRPELTVGDRVVKPAFVQNEHTAAPTEDGRYVARCVWTFPTKELTGSSRLSLRVRDADGREAHAFTIDLSRMR
jgi:hypothetical protein